MRREGRLGSCLIRGHRDAEERREIADDQDAWIAEHGSQ